MKVRQVRSTLILIIAGLIALPTTASAEVRCTFGGTEELLPTADRAISQWETSRSIALSPTVRTTLQFDLCRAVFDMTSQSGAPAQDIDAVSELSIKAYLDDVISDRIQFPSLAARLEETILLNASGRLPEQHRQAVVIFRYTKAVDEMMTENTHWGKPIKRLVSFYGTFSYQGLRGGQRVCGGTFVVSSSSGTVVPC